MSYRLLQTFESTFQGVKYKHRNSSLGDEIAVQLFEDLFEIGRSTTLTSRISDGRSVVNARNLTRGVRARRGDGTFGELVPHERPDFLPEHRVARGQIATVEIGVEIKILAKAMIKQIDRVKTVLLKQVDPFREGGGTPICVALVGVNWAEHCTGYEGDRVYPTDGRANKHPIQEAAEAEARLLERVRPSYDEFLILPFRATNESPFPFEWVKERETALDYGALLTRVSRDYDRRFSK